MSKNENKKQKDLILAKKLLNSAIGMSDLEINNEKLIQMRFLADMSVNEHLTFRFYKKATLIVFFASNTYNVYYVKDKLKVRMLIYFEKIKINRHGLMLCMNELSFVFVSKKENEREYQFLVKSCEKAGVKIDRSEEK